MTAHADCPPAALTARAGACVHACRVTPRAASQVDYYTEVFGKSTDRKSDGVHMRGVKGKTFLTETFIEAVGRAGLKDRDTRMEGRGGSALRVEQQEVGWSRVEGGARPAPQLDGQRSSWAEVANNRYYSLSN